MEYVAVIVMATGAAMLAAAQMKTFGIHRELKRLNETMAVHTKLLASIANREN